MIKINFISLFLIAIVFITGCIQEDDLSNEQKYHKLASEIMCPVCDAQTIEGSNSQISICLLYTSPSPRDVEESRMPSSA